MADDLSAPDVSFTVARHGFDRDQVRQHVRELAERTRRIEADRTEARSQLAELQGELEIARREITAMSDRLDTLGTPADEESAARLLEVARSQAGEITNRARAAADGTWAAAERASTELRDRYRKMLADLDAQHAEIHQTHKSILTTARAQAQELTTGAERRRTELDAEAERDRIRIDREFSERTRAQRAAFERELTDRRAACVAEVEERLRAADEEATRRVDAVTAQVKRLTEVRAMLSQRLRETQEMLDRSVSLLEPEANEADLAENPLPMPPAPAPGEAAELAARLGTKAAAAKADPAPADQEPVDPPAPPPSRTTKRPATGKQTEPTDDSAEPTPPEPPTDADGKRTVPPQRAKRSQAAKR
ncbi:MAG TPA: hypothetical protein VNP92_03495 [Actinophytocola sp.]|nr:hypothetical protein [Actinophytocola sp.]